jgi:hypothetical protein
VNSKEELERAISHHIGFGMELEYILHPPVQSWSVYLISHKRTCPPPLFFLPAFVGRKGKKEDGHNGHPDLVSPIILARTKLTGIPLASTILTPHYNYC